MLKIQSRIHSNEVVSAADHQRITALISGCSTFQEWFGSEEEDATAPVELERIDTKVKLKKQWSAKIGDGQGDGFYKITPP